MHTEWKWNGLALWAQNAIQLTIRVLERLLLFGWFRNNLDALRVEYSNIFTVSIEHFDGKHEMLPFVRITNVQSFCSAKVLKK